jgi:hypothetical protein
MIIYLSRFAYIEIAAARGAAHEMSGVVCRLASSATVWQNRHWALLEQFPIGLNQRRHCEERSDEALPWLISSRASTGHSEQKAIFVAPLQSFTTCRFRASMGHVGTVYCGGRCA